MSAVQLKSFGFGDQLVRVVERHGEAWFVGKDVCEALEIDNARNAMARLDDDEKDGVQNVDAIGRKQVMTIISESGVYALIFTSRKPAAKQFRRWVTQEVLPAIRRTGWYEMDEAAQAPIEDAPPGAALLDLPDEVEAMRVKLAVAREARVVFGLKHARKAWQTLGLLPALTDEAGPDGKTMLMPAALEKLHESVTAWMDARCDHAPGHMMQTAELHDDYVAWCVEEGVPREQVLNRISFGLALRNCGIPSYKNGRVYRRGLKLRAAMPEMQAAE